MITSISHRFVLAYSLAMKWSRMIGGVYSEEFYAHGDHIQGNGRAVTRCLPAIQMAALWIKIGERMRHEGTGYPRFQSTSAGGMK